MMGKLSRRKGAAYERELVHRFRDAMPGAEIKRGFQYRDGGEAPDVDCPVFWVEAKRGKKPDQSASLNGDCHDQNPEERHRAMNWDLTGIWQGLTGRLVREFWL